MLFKRRIKPGFRERMRTALWPRRSVGRSLRYFGKRVLRLRATPHAIAAGLAAGIFSSFIPILGVHIAVALAIAWIIGGNIAAAILGTTLGNPLFLPFIWGATLEAGRFILSGGPNRQADADRRDPPRFHRRPCGLFPDPLDRCQLPAPPQGRLCAGKGGRTLMIIGIGSDLIDIRRIEKTLERHGQRFIDRVYTPVEQARSERRKLRAASYAKRFAAKEACAKALGTGLSEGVFWRDMGVINLPSGAPTMRLTNGAARRLEAILPAGHTAHIHVTITDDFPLAQAFVIIEALKIVE
jgi:holo-[acyl-carrier protein] synthase